MRDIHPNYPSCTIACACGAKYPTRSTRGDFTVDVCGACHPFYTGKQKLMDTAGRVDRFRKKFGESKTVQQRKETPGATPAAAAAATAEKKAKKTKKGEAAAS
jgi:large subunit ribosomal protein L31